MEKEKFKQYLSKYNELKKKENELNNQIKQLKTKLLLYADKYPTLKTEQYIFDDNTIKFTTNLTYSSISQKYLKDTTIKYINTIADKDIRNKFNIEEFINFIITNRSSYEKNNILINNK